MGFDLLNGYNLNVGREEKKEELGRCQGLTFKTATDKIQHKRIYFSGTVSLLTDSFLASRGVPPSLVSSSSHHYALQILWFPL